MSINEINDNNQLSVGDKLKKLVDDDLPFFTRCFTFISIVLFIISFIDICLGFIKSLSNIPLYTVEHFYLWALITSSFGMDS